ncbi:hypothetical protein IW140_003302 [Coemansia sp. RSA 1813]|nr:hypothetical protein EV178_002921 [Coemansia sp. RSA 1646]KAJ1771710.1 hypothetical protein LPJ74_002137 [Coemansia sp. RSA 1843]KAJ2089653.1 hypothetical protein IW138_003251 [Coemansia sp. RSA 986]KAJ2214151.1 hypothetical protein EV179_003290 [Coemansia sp. RSA 487]KAJ2569210.1 hypothetical protein IW140_003302 [Coemansia sp. RSA 1813]
MTNGPADVLPEWAPGSHNYKVRGAVVMGVGIAYTLFALVTTVMLLVVARNKRSGLEKQSVKLLIFQSLGCYLVALDGLVTTAAYNWACFAKLWLFNIGFVMSLAAISARAFHLFVVYRAHDLTSKLASYNAQIHEPSHPMMARSSHSDKSTHMDPRLISALVPRHSGLRSTDFDRDDTYQRYKLQQLLRKHRRLLRFATDRTLLIYMALLLLIAVILTLTINVTDSQFAIRPVNIYCQLQWGFIPGLAIIGVYFFLVFPLILWRLWRYNDAYGIRNNLIVCDTIGSIIMILAIVWNTTRLQLIQQKWPGFFFVWLYALLIHISSVFVPLINAIRHMRRTDDADTHANGHNNLDGPSNGLGLSARRADFNLMLNDVVEYQRFRTFAASCFSSELTSFIEEYQMLKSRVLALLDYQETRTNNGVLVSPINQVSTHHDIQVEKEAVAGQTNRLSRIIVNNILSQGMDFTETFQRTSISVSILDTVIERYPDIDQVSLMFPPQLSHKITDLYKEFADPASLTSVNASTLVVRRISQSINMNYFHISLLDELKDEVLLMLYCDVYTRYVKKS